MKPEQVLREALEQVAATGELTPWGFLRGGNVVTTWKCHACQVICDRDGACDVETCSASIARNALAAADAIATPVVSRGEGADLVTPSVPAAESPSAAAVGETQATIRNEEEKEAKAASVMGPERGVSTVPGKAAPPRGDTMGTGLRCGQCKHKFHDGYICFEWVRGPGTPDDLHASTACGCLASLLDAINPDPAALPLPTSPDGQPGRPSDTTPPIPVSPEGTREATCLDCGGTSGGEGRHDWHHPFRPAPPPAEPPSAEREADLAWTLSKPRGETRATPAAEPQGVAAMKACKECGHPYWEHHREEPHGCTSCFCAAFDDVSIGGGKLLASAPLVRSPAPDPKPTVCEPCKGSGRWFDELTVEMVRCPTCGGTGTGTERTK